MAGGPLLPSSIYLGGASGLLSPAFYMAGAGTIGQAYIEGIGVVASLGSDAGAVLQFNLPEVLPTGVLKLRCLAWANATTGTAYWTISDGNTAPGSSIASTSLTAENSGNTYSQAWTTADIIVENKITLTPTPVVNNIFTVVPTFKHNSVPAGSTWSLAQTSVWQFSLVWE